MSLAHRLRQYLESEGIGYETLAHARTLTSSRSAQAAHVSGELLVKSVILHHELGYVVALAPSTLLGALHWTPFARCAFPIAIPARRTTSSILSAEYRQTANFRAAAI